MLDGIAGVWCGMAVINVKNGEISNNTVVRAAVGIHVLQVENFNISNNVVHDNFMFGIVVENDSNNVLVNDNIVYNHPEEGIVFDNPYSEVPDTIDSVITRNIIFDNGENGIYLGRSDDVNVTNNIIHDNTLNGITAADGDHIISDNTLYNNRGGIQISSGSNSIFNNLLDENRYGICVASTNNLIAQNLVSNCTSIGIRLHSQTSTDTYGSDNDVLNNTIVNCTDYGLGISSACNNNVIKWNNFINNSDACQINDNGNNNEFLENFYNDWIEPDSDFDGFVDVAYMCDGNAENSDQYPLTFPCQPIPDWITYSTTPTTLTMTNPPPLLELAIASGVIPAIALVVVILLKKRSR